MSIQIVGDPGAYCTMCRQFTYKLRWLPEKHHVAGTQIEIRSHKLRAFIGRRYAAFRIEKADITFRCKSRPTVSELRLNWDRILFRSTLMYGARKGEHVDFEIDVPLGTALNQLTSIYAHFNETAASYTRAPCS